MNKTINTFKTLVLSTVLIGMMAGCTTTHNVTSSERTAVEQLLISEAVMRSLPREPNGSLPIPRGSNVILDTSGISVAQGGSSDAMLLQQVLAAWLGQQGYLIQNERKDATHRIDVIVGSLGTELSATFIGMPPVQSVLIPFSLPELTLYKTQFQTGYVKFHMNIYEIPAGRFVASTPVFLGDTYYNDYTMLFLISFKSTNLLFPPQLGSFFRKTFNVPHPGVEDEAMGETGK